MIEKFLYVSFIEQRVQQVEKINILISRMTRLILCVAFLREALLQNQNAVNNIIALKTSQSATEII